MLIYRNIQLLKKCPLAEGASSDMELRLHVVENLWNDPLECSCGSNRPHCGQCGRHDVFVRSSIPEQTALMCGCVVLCDSIRCRRCGWTGPVIRQCRIGIKRAEKADEEKQVQRRKDESEYAIVKELVSNGIRPKLAYVRELEDKLGIPEGQRIPANSLRE